MIIVTNTFTRPTLDVEFYTTPADQSAEFMNKYRETGKALSTVRTLSADGLIATVTTKWVSRVAFDEFIADALSDTMRTGRFSYCEDHGIEVNLAITHEPTEGDMTA